MSSSTAGPGPVVAVRYWAGLKAAAGRDGDQLAAPQPLTLAQVLDHLHDLHRERPRFAEVLSCCSILVDARPVGTLAPEDVVVTSDNVVEFLPPFAGG